MARAVNKLSARGVAAIEKPGRHGDGGGLYLTVDKSGAKRWVFLYRTSGKLREMGLGSINAVPLAKARELAAVARAQLQAGIDPIAAKKEAPSQITTFGEMADEFLSVVKPSFRNAKHIDQWEMTLTDYAASLRPLPVHQVDTESVLAVLKPIWLEKNVTASRLRGRIERVLDAAKAKGLRSGENPARWRGHLVNLLSKRQKLTRGHHKAMDYADLPPFVGKLLQRNALAARALEFTILTAARSNETFGLKWDELDLKAKVWTVPPERMKGGREHRVPLTSAALAIIDQMKEQRNEHNEHVFPGMKRGRPLSAMAMEMQLRRMKIDVTVHGFRSTFRDWCGEETEFPRELAEAALAHVVGDETERAYRRGDALAKRRKLMEAWDNFCEPPAPSAANLFE